MMLYTGSPYLQMEMRNMRRRTKIDEIPSVITSWNIGKVQIVLQESDCQNGIIVNFYNEFTDLIASYTYWYEDGVE